MDCSPPGSSVHGILQAKVLEWVAISFSRGSSQPKDRTCVSYVSCIGKQVFCFFFFTTSATWEAQFIPKESKQRIAKNYTVTVRVRFQASVSVPLSEVETGS